MSFSRSDFCVIAAVNDERVLEQCLALSPDVASGDLPLTVIRDARSMAEAYNRGLAQTGAPICIFAHQDAYLPTGWLDRAIAALNALEIAHPEWTVAGPVGVMKDGVHVGRVWDVNMAEEHGCPLTEAVPVDSLDELLLILKRHPGAGFDPGLPSFHLYGTDLVQTAWHSGSSAWGLDLPLVHNNRPWASLSGGYQDAYHYVRRKWRGRLPIQTTVCPVTNNPLPLWRVQWRRRKVKERGPGLLAHAPDVARKAGYE